MENPEITLLTEGQIWGNENESQLDVLKKYGTKAAITDLAILTGSDFEDDSSYNIAEDKSLSGRASVYGYWIMSASRFRYVCAVDLSGNMHDYVLGQSRYGCVRPVINVPKIFSKISSNKTRGFNGTDEVEYGEYPQMVADSKMQEILEKEYQNGIKKTGRTYTFDFRKWHDYDNGFWGITYDEYEYRGKNYIRVMANARWDTFKLSNGVEYANGKYVWVEVSPVKWLIDDKTETLISKKCLVSGIRFLDKIQKYDGDFSKTEMKKYLDKYMSKDLFQNTELLERQLNKSIIESDLSKEEKKNIPYNFDFAEATEEEIIRGAVESNIAVFLHGRSSEGKSARVKQIDKDAEIIYLRNATPDSLNGKSVYNSNTNEMIDIPPTWYKKLVKKCEEEPDKIHIVFFDEITNALPSIQGMAFNIVLDGEVNGIWKLPPNARIVAAGNDLEDSKAANEMAEPLFNRFAHVYINTTVDSWLKWASTPIEEYERLDYKGEEVPRKIHPSIYAYIAYKSYSKQDVLRTEYNGKTPNADPRKWEMASKVLYSTGKPEMLRALIGESLTRDFIYFVKEQVLTVEDVVNGNYTESDLEMSVSEKYNTAVGLSSVDEEHIEVVRNFVLKLGPEICAMFDTLWAHGDEKRLEKIAELKLSERTK